MSVERVGLCFGVAFPFFPFDSHCRPPLKPFTCSSCSALLFFFFFGAGAFFAFAGATTKRAPSPPKSIASALCASSPTSPLLLLPSAWLTFPGKLGAPKTSLRRAPFKLSMNASRSSVLSKVANLYRKAKGTC